MEKEFVPYAVAVKLKELGFDEPCFAGYRDSNWIGTDGPNSRYFHAQLFKNSQFDDDQIESCSAPTLSQAFRWFREKYDWQHSIEPTADQHSHLLGYNYWIWNYKTGEEQHTMPKNRPTGDWEYETYEEAELECIKKLIEIVENK